MTSFLPDMPDISPRPAGHAPLPRDLVRALEWLKTHFAEPFRLDELATQAGVSPRTLEAHFRTYLGTTPLGWARQMRLSRARQQLVDGDGATVTDIAQANGFSQLGRFAGQYRAHFGESPSQTRARGREPIDDKAALLTWQSLSSAYFVSSKECNRAMEGVAQAQEIAPQFGLPRAIEAWCRGQRTAFNFTPTANSRRGEIVRLAVQAAELAPNDSLTLTVCSGAMALAHRLGDADRMVERAIAIDPLSPLPWMRRGWVSAYLGDSRNAVREFAMALHMLPFRPMAHVAYIGMGCAHFVAERYDNAARWTIEGVQSHPGAFWGYRIAAAAAVHHGNRTEARRIARNLLRKDPDLTVTAAQSAMPFAPEVNDRLSDGLRSAGVPLR